MHAQAQVIGSEIALALYPILIKLVPTNLPTQLASRLLTQSGAGLAFSTPRDCALTWGSFPAALQSLGYGAITLVHILASYVAFSELPAGVSMTLFQTYPFWTIAAGWAFFKEHVDTGLLPQFGSALAGTQLLSTRGVLDDVGGVAKLGLGGFWGVGAALLSALTETAMQQAVRTSPVGKEEGLTSNASILSLQPGAMILLMGALLLTKYKVDLSWKVWLPMVAFNLVVGFAGYSLRFDSIPKLPVATFSLLTFVGVIASFVWGYLFAKEKPSWITLLGVVLVLVALRGVPPEAVK